jgi:hypothetical protein
MASIDAATSTVSIGLRGDGQYDQQIVRNGGETLECPGGAWALDGPYLCDSETEYKSIVFWHDGHSISVSNVLLSTRMSALSVTLNAN